MKNANLVICALILLRFFQDLVHYLLLSPLATSIYLSIYLLSSISQFSLYNKKQQKKPSFGSATMVKFMFDSLPHSSKEYVKHNCSLLFSLFFGFLGYRSQLLFHINYFTEVSLQNVTMITH